MSEDNGKASSSNFLPKNSTSQAKEVQKERDSFSSKYKIIDKIGEGSYSEVLKCKHRESGILVACKRLKHSYRNWHQVNDIAEITTMRALPKHINILQMVETHFDQSLGKVSLVFEIMDLNLYELIKDRKRVLGENRVRLLMFQLMRAIRHLHKHGIFHRDIKPENILLRTKTDLLKLGDLGSVRGLYSRPPYTEYISTRWYRSPECLLTAGYYSFKMDIWAAACVFYEIMTLRPLFPGSSEIDQVNRIHKIMGPPPSRILQKFFKQYEIDKENYRNRTQQARWDQIHTALEELSSIRAEGKSKNFDWYFSGGDGENGIEKHLPTAIGDDAKELLIAMLSYDPDARPTAHRVLCHTYFRDAVELHKDKDNKSPAVPLLGDEKTRQALMSMDIDLKTLGDKKLKRQKQQRYALIQKQTEAKIKASQLESKVPSVVLETGSSPFTPDEKQIAKDVSRNVMESARLSTIEILKKQNQIQAKKVIAVDQKNTELEMAQKRLSFRRKEDTPDRKSVDSSISSGKSLAPHGGLLRDKIEAILKTKHSIQRPSNDPKQNLMIGNSTMSPFPRNRVMNVGKSEGIATKLSALDSATKLQQVYLSKVLDRKVLNKNALSLSATSSRSTLGKDKVNVPSGIPRYETVIKTKLPTLMRSEDSPFKPKVADTMTGAMFPRNRLGPGSRTDSSTKATLQQPATKFSQVHPVKVLDRRQPVPAVGNARGGVSLPSKIDHLSSNPSHQIRPPLPPPKRLRRGPDFDYSKEGISTHENKNLGDGSSHKPSVKFHLEGIAAKLDNPDQVQKASEAMHRRAARIKASVKDDVYCSSDEDILSSMRKKFDDLISQRVKRYYSKSDVDSNNNSPMEVVKEPDPTTDRTQRLQRYLTKNI